MTDDKIKLLDKIKDERGSALVTALLISSLLLIASAGLIFEASMNSLNVTDAVSEQQAFNAAESGIQSAIHVLRCQKNNAAGCVDVQPSPLVAPSASPTDPSNQIDYIKAVDTSISNAPGDTSTSSRLSRWLKYDTTCRSTNDCVALNTPGYAFSLAVSDPDNTNRYASWSMSGRLFDNDGTPTTRKTYNRDSTGTPTPNDTMTIEYIPPTAVTNQDMSSGTFTTTYGTFKMFRTGNGAIVPTNNRFEIVVRVTRPFTVVKTIRGWIKATTDRTVTPTIVFDSQTLTLVGSLLTVNLSAAPSTGWTFVGPPIAPAVGYQGIPTVGTSATPYLNVIGGTVSKFEPIRLPITSTGYGPRGSKKQLQAIIQKNFFNGLTAPAALTLIGPHHTDSPTSDFFFSAGNSAVLQYSGVDQAGTDIIPPIGTTNGSNLSCIEDYIAHAPITADCALAHANGSDPFNGSITGTISDVTTETPFWLETPGALDAEIHRLAITAMPGRFFPAGVVPPDWGNAATGQGLTFCDGDVTIGQHTGDGTGGGILVVTGTLTLDGSFTFNGMIIVTGPGGVARSGGGSGSINGNLIIAPYVNGKIADIVDPATDLPAGSSFLSPRYDMDGGGNSTLQYNSQSLANGLTAISNFVLGVMEK